MPLVKERPYGLAWHWHGLAWPGLPQLGIDTRGDGEEMALPRQITQVASREEKGAKNAINPVNLIP